jgi:dihydroneopterin aldolase/2-amino-4-hydroxy-6-hydroxymethyldihydropteridine diphosphokinase/dihydropteroate synthase
MQIFNATPDSFSDGSQDHLDLTLAMKAIEGMFATPHPPDIMDIGGMSTRPNSTPCTEEEELERVVPLIRAIRSSANELLAKVAISIDTYRPTVAHRAVEAGASCINDVRGGRESGMMATMAELGVPVVLMHSRGDSTSMLDSQSQDYSFGGVVQGVKAELEATVGRALDTGVRKWNIVIDPGLGFAKNHHQNLELIRRIDELAVGSILRGVPVLLGGSRKGFVGRVIKRGTEEVSLRGYGDAAVVGWCCVKGVEVVRVHDGRGMSEVIKMHAAIRSPEEE